MWDHCFLLCLLPPHPENMNTTWERTFQLFRTWVVAHVRLWWPRGVLQQYTSSWQSLFITSEVKKKTSSIYQISSFSKFYFYILHFSFFNLTTCWFQPDCIPCGQTLQPPPSAAAATTTKASKNKPDSSVKAHLGETFCNTWRSFVWDRAVQNNIHVTVTHTLVSSPK